MLHGPFDPRPHISRQSQGLNLKAPHYLLSSHTHRTNFATWNFSLKLNPNPLISAAQETLVTFHLVTTCDCKSIQDGILIPCLGPLDYNNGLNNFPS